MGVTNTNTCQGKYLASISCTQKLSPELRPSHDDHYNPSSLKQTWWELVPIQRKKKRTTEWVHMIRNFFFCFCHPFSGLAETNPSASSNTHITFLVLISDCHLHLATRASLEWPQRPPASSLLDQPYQIPEKKLEINRKLWHDQNYLLALSISLYLLSFLCFKCFKCARKPASQRSWCRRAPANGNVQKRWTQCDYHYTLAVVRLRSFTETRRDTAAVVLVALGRCFERELTQPDDNDKTFSE